MPLHWFSSTTVSLLLALLCLPAAGASAGAAAPPVLAPLVLAIDIDVAAMEGAPGLLGDGTLALRLEASRRALFKLEAQGELLAAGELLPGSNPLHFTRPGLADRSQSLVLQLELLESGAITRKTIRVTLTVDPGMEAPAPGQELSGSFAIAMFHAGRAIGFRKKRMVDLLNLKTGPTMAVPDPGLSGAAGRSPSAGQSIPLLGTAMALAKYLAGKKAEKKLRAHAAEAKKKRLALTLRRGQREIPVLIELRVE